MKISIVIPVYNGERFIGKAVASAINQCYLPHDIIVINDGSTDRTADRLRAFGDAIRVIEQSNAGRSSARNCGIAAATGEYIAFLDADDEFLPTHLEQLVQGAADGQSDIVYDSCASPYVAVNKRPPRRPEGRNAWKHFRKYELWVVTSMVRRQLLVDTGIRFPPGIEMGEDAIFFYRLILAGASVRYVRKRGCNIGIHDANTTADPRKEYVDHFAVIENDIQMRGGVRASVLLNALQTSRNHSRLMATLAHIAMDDTLNSWAYVCCMLRYSLSRHMLASDRGRALAAVCWLVATPLRSARFTRCIFGFFISARMAQLQGREPGGDASDGGPCRE